MSSIAATSKANGKTERTRLTRKEKVLLKDWFLLRVAERLPVFYFQKKLKKL